MARENQEAVEMIWEVMQVVTETQKSSRSPLQLQVDHLSRQVQHQGRLIRDARRPNSP